MIKIKRSIRYLRESLSNYTEEDNISSRIYDKMEHNNYEDIEVFIEGLEEDEILYLDGFLEKEIKYAQQASDELRAQELTEIYSLLF
ncbi:sporulation protein [Virgibacillus sp. W0181]|uniref:sporulation protein n=1 Tax=Virgibacillus sp. W0181 TaxID=3391581 RepID=UPI003F482DD3